MFARRSLQMPETPLIEPFRGAVIFVPVHGFPGRVHGYRTPLGKPIKRLDACFAADAAVVEASPWRRGIEPVMIVHPDHAEQQPACHSVSASDIVGPDRRGEPKP